MSDARKLYRSIVGYGIALTAVVETGAACSSPRRGPMREGPTPAYCDQNDCSLRGTLVDEHDRPVANATITYGAETTTTDAAGAWKLSQPRYSSNESGRLSVRTADGRMLEQEIEDRSSM